MVALEFPTSIKWLFLDLNSYFASVEQQCRPELRGKPVAVVPLETDATCAIAASYEAKAYGIKTGTLIYEAKRLCPDLICIKADHERYVDFHHAIIQAVECYISVTHVASIDEVACELDVRQSNPKQAIALAKQIKQGIHEQVGEMIHCSIGIAPNRFLAKVATEIEKPNGLVVIQPEDIPGKLFDLSFDDIPGIGRNMQKRLHRNNIHTMEQLYNISPKHMRTIWHSVGGERMWYNLRGVELESEPTKRRTVGHSHMLAPENRYYPNAQMIAKRLLFKAASRLRRLGYYATTLDISIRIEHGPRLASDIRFRPLCDNANLLEQWESCWQKLLCQSPFEQPRIKKVSITLHGLVSEMNIQPDLFEQGKSNQNNVRRKNEKLSKTIDLLNKRFGRNTITTAATLGNANTVTGTKIAFSRIPETAEFYE